MAGGAALAAHFRRSIPMIIAAAQPVKRDIRRELSSWGVIEA